MRECCELVGNLCRILVASRGSWSPKLGFHPFPTCLAAVPIEWCRFRKEKLCWGWISWQGFGVGASPCSLFFLWFS